MSSFSMMIATVIAAAITSSAFAAPAINNNASHPHGQGAPGDVHGYASTHKLAYYYTRGGSDRSVNVLSMTHPKTGVFCIQPLISLNLDAIYPQVTAEWGQSHTSEPLVYWQDTTVARDCPAKWLEVLTYDGEYSPAIPSDNVAWALAIR